MYIKSQRQHFLNLLMNKKFAQDYFSEKIIDIQFNSQKLLEIQNQLLEAKTNYYKAIRHLALFSQLKGIKVPSIIHSNIEKTSQEKREKDAELEIFESNLAYLIISSTMNMEDCIRLGFEPDYIKKLLIFFRKQVNKALREFDDDETYQLEKLTQESADALDRMDEMITEFDSNNSKARSRSQKIDC